MAGDDECGLKEAGGKKRMNRNQKKRARAARPQQDEGGGAKDVGGVAVCYGCHAVGATVAPWIQRWRSGRDKRIEES